MHIGKIVTNRLPVKVLSWSASEGMCFKPIVNHWRREAAENKLVTVKTYRGSPGSKQAFVRSKTLCTAEHEFYTRRAGKLEKVWASKLVPGKDAILTQGSILDAAKRDLLIGSLLGDGYMAFPKRSRLPYFQERHCIKQQAYLQFKADALVGFTHRGLREYNAGFDGFNVGQQMVEWSSHAHPEFMSLHEMFYGTGERRFSQKVFDALTLRSLAVWFQDDGSAGIYGNNTGPSVSFACQAFTPAERVLAANAIERLTDIKFNVNDGDGTLRKHGDDAVMFLLAITDYVHPSMGYKLCGIQGAGTRISEFLAPAVLGLVEMPVDAVEDAGLLSDHKAWRGEYLFNLEVEDTHRYFVNGVLVGNSDRTQDEVWTAIQTGQLPPTPKPTFAYEKFISYLNALGVNVEKAGNEISAMPLTGGQIDELSNGELTDGGKIVRGKDLRPEKGGLFDEDITGGVGGKNWSHIKLGESLPNPLFEKSIRNLLGLTGKQYDSVVAGDAGLDEKGAFDEDAEKKGPQAIVSALGEIDVDESLGEASSDIKTARRGELDKVNKRIKYLLMLKRTGITPREAYVLDKVPVLPPIFRPVSMMEGGDLNVDGLNLLYKDVAILTAKLHQAIDVLPDEEVAPLRKGVYDALEALMGTNSVADVGTTLDGSARPPGILTILAGRRSPKESYFHRKLLDRKQDISMRSVIIPDMTLHLDELGLPRKGAMKIFQPFVVKELRNQGFTPLAAKAEIERNTPLANRALEVAASKRPVLFKRDPVLHKFGIMAFKAKIIDSKKAIHIHPLVVGGFNADFDGDTMAIFVPVTQEAVDEAYGMMPSKNLFNPATGRVMYQPTLEGQLGLFLMTQMGKKTSKKYDTKAQALKAEKDKTILATDIVTVDDKRTTVGRLKFNDALPKSIRSDKYLTDPKIVMNSKRLQAVLRDLALKAPAEFAHTADRIKDLGFGHAYSTGFSFSLDDFGTLRTIRGKHLAVASAAAKAARAKGMGKEATDAKLVSIYTKATNDIGTDAKAYLQTSGNKLYAMSLSGSKPSWSQVSQMITAPMLMQNAAGRVIPVPVTRSYGEGLDSAGYWTAASGARKGLIEKVQSVREPGALSKQIINTLIPLVVTTDDCGTTRGIAMKTSSSDVVDRFTAKSHKVRGVTIPANTAVTPALLSRFKAAKIDVVSVRSPTKCTAAKGMCSKCYGLSDGGSPIALGENIGIVAGQAIGERSTQLSMRTFHTGGVASEAGGAGGLVAGIGRVTQLLKMPKILPNKATLASMSGTVTGVKKSAVGGYDVAVGTQQHYVPHGNGLSVKVGTTVRKGDSLSKGPIDPRELLSLTNMDRVQRYLTDELHDVYKSEGVKRRSIEVVVRGLTNLGRVESAGEVGDAEGIIRNDYVSLSHTNALNAKNRGKSPIKVTPELRGVETLPLDQTTDWLARMQYRKLRETMTRAANEGWKSDTHGLHPTPGIIYSAEFGKGDISKGAVY